MNKERNQKKWQPFESLFHQAEVIKELNEKRNFLSKPILSEDEEIEIENSLKEAYRTKNPIILTYYYQGRILKAKGLITFLNPKTSQIFFQNHFSLYFEQILQVSFL